MKIHKVRSPFMSRVGQFESGKQTLAIGLDLHALQTTDIFRCYLGTNTKCYYQIDSKEAMVLSTTKYNSVWTNKAGKKVAILPIKDFERVETDEYNKPKQRTENVPQAQSVSLPLF